MYQSKATRVLSQEELDEIQAGRERAARNRSRAEAKRKQQERKKQLVRRRRKVLLILFLVLLIFGAAFGYFLYQNSYVGKVAKGYDALQMKEYQTAEKYFKHAIGKNAQRAEAYSGLAETYMEQMCIRDSNSVRATKLALKISDITITEAGFGADLGAEKFMDIKCRKAGLKPDAVVLVATVRALKYNGGVAKQDLGEENLEALKKGIVNLEKHIENIQKYGVPVVVTLNSFVTDTEAENEFIRSFCEERDCEFALAKVWEKGGEGGIELAEKVLDTLENKESNFHVLYEDELSLTEKIEKISKEIYGANGVVYEPAAKKQLAKIEEMGFGHFPICMAKNQYSLSDDAKKLGRPENFDIHIREVYVSAGAGFVVALTGAVMTMPGLPKVPAANNIDVTDDGKITGLF